VHGFDEFFGNLYHLNAEEEPESPNWPPAEDFPRFNELARPRGVIHSWATDEHDDAVDGRYGPRGKQRIEDTGPLTRKRMETVDDETTDACIDFIRRQHDTGTPFFVWMNTTHMHFRTHTKPESLGQAGRWQSPYHDTMIDHDKNVGQLLDALDELGIAEDTIVVYSTDNGPHMNSWPDAGMTPFRNEKNSNWEGAFRVPEMIRWPDRIPAGVVSNEMVQHHEWLPTFLAAAGDTGVVDDLRAGKTVADRTYKVHIDGFNLLPYLTGEEEKPPGSGSSTSPTTATVSRCASTTGRSSSWSSAWSARCRCGRNRSCPFASRSCTTCAPTSSSGPASRRTRTTTGCWTTPTWSSPRRR
jgi:arylsulfatase